MFAEYHVKVDTSSIDQEWNEFGWYRIVVVRHIHGPDFEIEPKRFFFTDFPESF